MSASTNPNESSQMTAPSGGGGGSSGGVPDLMKIGSIPVNTVQEVETAILEPVVRSDTFARFVLPNKGLLHSHYRMLRMIVVFHLVSVLMLLFRELL